MRRPLERKEKERGKCERKKEENEGRKQDLGGSYVIVTQIESVRQCETLRFRFFFFFFFLTGVVDHPRVDLPEHKINGS
jgi:hypothetical protein